MAVADQSSVSHSVLAVSKMEMGKRLGGDTAETAALSWLKAWPIPYAVMLSNTDGQFGLCSETAWASVCLGKVASN